MPLVPAILTIRSNTAAEFFLGDALGSVRQLTMTDGEFSLAQSYDPYGNVTFTSGGGTSPFAYTGEQRDASGLSYLRARYYNPAGWEVYIKRYVGRGI